MKLERLGGYPLWEWGCNDCTSLSSGGTLPIVEEGGEARAVVAAARRHTRTTGHATWVHNILMWDIWAP
jgi:hypothetical protein